MISVKDFCEKYDCDISGVYKKIKRNRDELGEHIVKEGGIYFLDEEAEIILLPAIKKYRAFNKIAEADELEKVVKRLENEFKEFREKNAEFQKSYDFIFQRNQTLEKENEELRKIIRRKDF